MPAGWTQHSALPLLGSALKRMSLPAGARAVEWLETANGITRIRSARHGEPLLMEDDCVYIIGIDPHKGSHTAVAIDRDDCLSVRSWCAPIVDNASDCCGGRRHSNRECGPSKGATGTGALLAQQLVARARLCSMCRPRSRRGRGCWTEPQGHDRSRRRPFDSDRRLRTVALEDHCQILRLLARRHHQLTAARIRAIGPAHDAELASQ